MEQLEWLVARAAITDLISRYAILFDDQNWDDFDDLWTDDASFEVDDQGFFGKAAVIEFLSNCLPPGYLSKHMLSLPLIELSEDGRTAIVRTDVVWIPQSFENKIVARYNDEVVRGDDDQWRFRRRWETPVPHDPAPAPMSDAAIAMSTATMRTDPTR